MTETPTQDRIARVEAQVMDDEQRIDNLIDEIESLESLISPRAQRLIRRLRPHTVTDDVYTDIEEQESLGDRLADRIAELAGSWGFIGGFLVFMTVWMGLNVLLATQAFDPFPFILLNLGLSTLAALQAPVILMSQNRQTDIDRAVARNDFEVNLKNELEIADLHRKMDLLNTILQQQTQLLREMNKRSVQTADSCKDAIYCQL